MGDGLVNPYWMFPWAADIKTPAQIAQDEAAAHDRERRRKLHDKAVERRKKQKKNHRRSKK